LQLVTARPLRTKSYLFIWSGRI